MSADTVLAGGNMGMEKTHYGDLLASEEWKHEYKHRDSGLSLIAPKMSGDYLGGRTVRTISLGF